MDVEFHSNNDLSCKDKSLKLNFEPNENEDFYSKGSDDLLEFRKYVLKFSLKKSSERITKLQDFAQCYNFIKVLKHRRNINNKLSKVSLFGSQSLIDNSRFISIVRFSNDDKYIAYGTYDGSLIILNKDDLSLRFQLSSIHHTGTLTGLDWGTYLNDFFLLSGGSEGNICLWDTKLKEEDQILKPKLVIEKAHDSRIMESLFHPSGNHFVSFSLDQTWKLWDIQKSKSIYQQDGHSKGIIAGSIHPDGSLLVSGGFDSTGIIWDLRSGRSILTLEKHANSIHAFDWNTNGWFLASGSADCTIKIWDIRKMNVTKNELHSIPAHTRLITDLRFFNNTTKKSFFEPVTDEYGKNSEILDSCGSFLISSSHDGQINIWSTNNWIKVNTLEGHNDKVTSCDINNDGSSIVSCGWDRTVKLWVVS